MVAVIKNVGLNGFRKEMLEDARPLSRIVAKAKVRQGKRKEQLSEENESRSRLKPKKTKKKKKKKKRKKRGDATKPFVQPSTKSRRWHSSAGHIHFTSRLELPRPVNRPQWSRKTTYL